MKTWAWAAVSLMLVSGSVLAGDDTPGPAPDKTPAASTAEPTAKPKDKPTDKPKAETAEPAEGEAGSEGEAGAATEGGAPPAEPSAAPPAPPPAEPPVAEPATGEGAVAPAIEPPPMDPEPRPEPNMPGDEGPSELTIAGGTLLALGGVGIIVGAVFGGIAMSETADAKDQCPDKVCPQGVSAEEIKDDIRPKAEVSTITLTLGTATAITGIILLFVPENSQELGLDIQAGPDAAGLSFSGHF